jgi:hypothetical protein
MYTETDRTILMGNIQGIKHAGNEYTRKENNMLNLNGEVYKHPQKCLLQDTAIMSPNKIHAKFQDFKPKGRGA